MNSARIRWTHRLRLRWTHRLRQGVALSAALMMAGCSTVSGMSDLVFGSDKPVGPQPGYIKGFVGGVAADEPRAALVARDVLSSGGNAADAAVALAMMLTVTLPSRASLGGGGACLAYRPDGKGGLKEPQAIMFLPQPASQIGGSSRPAAIPAMAQGFQLLNSRFGSKSFRSLVLKAEETARFGFPVSAALAADFQVVGGALLEDAGSRAVFGTNGWLPGIGDQLVQPELANSLLRLRGFGDQSYEAAIEAAAPKLGLRLTIDASQAKLVPPVVVRAGRDSVAFLPPPADGGIAAAAAFKLLQSDPGQWRRAQQRAEAAASAWRSGHASVEGVLNGAGSSRALPPLPASTSFVTMDRDGNAVSCALTMNNLFGNGEVLPGTGILLAASPDRGPQPLLSAALAWNPAKDAFRAATAGSGQEGAPLAAGAAMANALRSREAIATKLPEPTRMNAIGCAGYLPGSSGSCGWVTDPKGAGVALGAR
ncbi:Gamma-glutamyltranspeptidase [Granulibacter bethesdensis]|nr:Gamma-glutamyltranspeptidase [Granulibacter bethesdensis]